MPEISVVIPLYNKGPHIGRALRSVLNQTFQDFEVVVVDGGSTDEGPAVVRSFDDRRISLFLQEGTGVSTARNQAVERSRADLVAFLDADDEWMPGHLETVLRLRGKHPEAGMYATAYRVQTMDGEVRSAEYRELPEPPWEGLMPNYFKSAALGEYPVITSGMAVPKSIFEEVGGFPIGYWWGEDADLFGKIALKYPVAFGWELGVIYHCDASNRACDKRSPLDHEEPFVKTAREAIEAGMVPPDLLEPLIEYISLKEINRAFLNISAGRSDDAEVILKQCKTRYHHKLKIKALIMAKIPPPLFLFLKKMARKIWR